VQVGLRGWSSEEWSPSGTSSGFVGAVLLALALAASFVMSPYGMHLTWGVHGNVGKVSHPVRPYKRRAFHATRYAIIHAPGPA
jgi:hypothetical protein